MNAEFSSGHVQGGDWTGGRLVSNSEDRKTPERKVQWMDLFPYPPLLTITKLPQSRQLQDQASLLSFRLLETSRLLRP